MIANLINTHPEYLSYLTKADELFDKTVSPDSAEVAELQIALQLIKQYEDKHFRIPLP